MEFTKMQKISISAFAVIVLLTIYIVFDRKSINNKNNNDLVKDNQISTTTENNIKYNVEKLENNSISSSFPDLNRIVKIYPGAKVSSQSTSISVPKIIDLQSLLKKNPKDFLKWLELGSYQSMAGDYEGAIISWKYASQIVQTDHIALGNIANLYAYQIKDSIKAEEYYKKAIFRGKTQPHLYSQLAEVYRDMFKDSIKAKEIIDQGLLNIPNDPNLLEFKASLQ